MRKWILALAAAMFIPATAQAVDADLLISGPIGRNVGAAADAMHDLHKAGKTTINIIIDSPGGSVYAGWYLINHMRDLQARGVEMRCYVTGMAASMAYQILSVCDKRYALEYSLLLWHPVRINVRQAVLPKDARQLAMSLSYIEKRMVVDLRRVMRVTDRYFFRHYHAETLHTGLDLVDTGFIELVRQSPNRTDNTKSAQGSIFGMRGLIYMKTEMLEMWRAGRSN